MKITKEYHSKRYSIFFLFNMITIFYINAQVTIGAAEAPQNFSILELISNSTGGLRLPQLTTKERNKISSSPAFISESNRGERTSSKALGLVIYNLDSNLIEFWNGEEWLQLGNKNKVDNNKLKMTVGNNTFTITLESNDTATAFKNLLPLTLNMFELNSNEKYYSLPQSLPVDASYPITIQSGDLMLYGSSTIVLFYKTFTTSYSYTRIGRVDNSSELESALGNDNVIVKFEN